jgi:hypothetical protein
MMSRFPLLYFSRGQLESLDWPDPVDDVAAIASIGCVRIAPMTISHWSKKVLIDFIEI